MTNTMIFDNDPIIQTDNEIKDCFASLNANQANLKERIFKLSIDNSDWNKGMMKNFELSRRAKVRQLIARYRELKGI